MLSSCDHDIPHTYCMLFSIRNRHGPPSILVMNRQGNSAPPHFSLVEHLAIQTSDAIEPIWKLNGGKS